MCISDSIFVICLGCRKKRQVHVPTGVSYGQTNATIVDEQHSNEPQGYGQPPAYGQQTYGQPPAYGQPTAYGQEPCKLSSDFEQEQPPS